MTYVFLLPPIKIVHFAKDTPTKDIPLVVVDFATQKKPFKPILLVHHLPSNMFFTRNVYIVGPKRHRSNVR
jgi:hypothetical protein